MKVVLVTGGFDPLHSGHISLFEEAKKLGDHLIVGVNSDDWLTRKKGRPFMNLNERLSVIKSIKSVTGTVRFNDDDDTAIDAIRKVRLNYPSDTIIFANGGDRTADNIPEMSINDADVKFVFGVGGQTKMNSSSWLLDSWKHPKTDRDWGYYRVLYEVPGAKVKELTVNPGQSLSMQKHSKRNEFWLVTNGMCDVRSMLPNGYMLPITLLKEHSTYRVSRGDWHQLTNPYEIPCKIVEIQYGEECTEEDIIRRN